MKCTVCVVVRGLFRLRKLTERTIWIDRASTLQETLAPLSEVFALVDGRGDVRILWKRWVWH